MARYCFYCGRQLNSGEKCGCRSAGNGGASAQQARSGPESQPEPERADASQKGQSARQSSPFGGHLKPTNWLKRLITAFNPWAGTDAASAQRPSGKTAFGTGSSAGRRKSASGPRSSARHRQASPVRFDRHRLLSGLRAAGNYFVHPADQISQSVRAENRLASLLILALNGITGGLFLNMATRQPHLKVLFSLNTATAVGRQTPGTFLFLFIQGFGINLAASLLLVLIYHLSLRYVFHRPTGYMKLLHSLCPSVLYFSVFVLSGLLTLNRSPFTALLMAVAGFAVAAVIQFLSLKQLTGLEDNRSLMLISFVLLVFSSILALMFNLSLPVLNALLDQTAII